MEKIKQIESILRDLRLSLKHLIIGPSGGHIDWSVEARGLWAAGHVPDVYDPFTILSVITAEIVKLMRPSGSLPQTVVVSDRAFRYIGPVYVRPIGRGLVLKPDVPEEDEYLAEVLSRLFPHGDYDMEIIIRVLPVEDDDYALGVPE